MFEAVLDHRPRGFCGRPLISLVFVVVTGFAAGDADPLVGVGAVIGAFFAIVWHLCENAGETFPKR
jgi:hypothetical protein